MTSTITYYRRDVYGQSLMYPKNTTGIIFCQIIGSKTITPKLMAGAIALGYTLVEVLAP